MSHLGPFASDHFGPEWAGTGRLKILFRNLPGFFTRLGQTAKDPDCEKSGLAAGR